MKLLGLGRPRDVPVGDIEDATLAVFESLLLLLFAAACIASAPTAPTPRIFTGFLSSGWRRQERTGLMLFLGCYRVSCCNGCAQFKHVLRQ